MPTCSPARLAANRANALKSTGPRTPAGKRRSALNATTHGLRAANPTPTLPNEDPAPFCAFRDQLHADHAPGTALEVALVDRLASLLWRLNRCPTLENDLAYARLVRRRADHEDQYDPDRPRWRPPPFQAPRPQILLADDFSLRDDRANPLMRLQRYEAALERSVQRTLAQLHALQKLRAPDPDTDADTDPDADAPHAEESPIEPAATDPASGTGDPPVSSPPPNNQNQQNEPTAESARDAGVSPAQPQPELPNEPTADAPSTDNAASTPSAPLRSNSSLELPNEPTPPPSPENQVESPSGDSVFRTKEPEPKKEAPQLPAGLQKSVLPGTIPDRCTLQGPTHRT